jgi:hypothetical protein
MHYQLRNSINRTNIRILILFGSGSAGLGASVDPTDARKATVRRFGRSDRRAQGAGSGPALSPCALSLAETDRVIKWFWDALSA